MQTTTLSQPPSFAPRVRYNPHNTEDWADMELDDPRPSLHLTAPISCTPPATGYSTTPAPIITTTTTIPRPSKTTTTTPPPQPQQPTQPTPATHRRTLLAAGTTGYLPPPRSLDPLCPLKLAAAKTLTAARETILQTSTTPWAIHRHAVLPEGSSGSLRPRPGPEGRAAAAQKLVEAREGIVAVLRERGLRVVVESPKGWGWGVEVREVRGGPDGEVPTLCVRRCKSV